jgi:NADH dehydrogenase
VKIFITGISGFLGSALARVLVEAGHVVSGSARRPSVVPEISGVTRIVPYTLDGPVDKEWFSGLDAIIHAAHDFGDQSTERNIAGAQSICREGELAAVRKQIFLSSYSARPDACGVYGRVKYTLETFFLRQGHTIVRPGLVIGNGGMFGRNLRTVLASPVIPLLDNGADRIPVIALRDFLPAMRVILESAPAGAYNLFNPELVSMRRLMDTVGRIAGRHPRYVPIRSSWAVLFLTAMKRLRIPFPSNVDNLTALKLNQDCIHHADLLDILPSVCSLEAMMQDALLTLKKIDKNKS